MQSAVEMGCRGGTSNPPLVLKAANADGRWAVRSAALSRDHAPEVAARLLANEIRLAAAEMLLPVFEATGGKEGRLCVQVDPRNREDAKEMLVEAGQLAALAPNLYVKIPLTACGLIAMRDLLDRGIWVTATVSFTVSQVLAVTGMYSDFRKTWRGADPPGLAAVLMVGRIDDYLRVLNEQRGAQVPESIITQAGVAVAKRAYRLLRDRDLPGLLLLAAPRGLYHITEFLEMDAVMTAGPAVRDLAYNSTSPLVPGSAPTDEAIEALAAAFPEFARAYEPDGLSVDEFAGYGATLRTLDEFVTAQNGLERFVRECAGSAPV
jgi:transaldolase